MPEPRLSLGSVEADERVVRERTTVKRVDNMILV